MGYINSYFIYINDSIPTTSFDNMNVMNLYTRNIKYLTNDIYYSGINKNDGLFLLGTRI